MSKMNLYTTTRTALLLIAAVSLSGCALKPKATTRFEHPVNANGSCNCYSCQQAAATPVSATPLASCQSCQAGEEYASEGYAGEVYTGEISADQFPRELYAIPSETESNQVEPFNTLEPTPINEELPVVEEITPSVSDNSFETDGPLLAVGGGGFKSIGTDSGAELESDPSDDILISPSDPEPTLAQKPAESNDFGSLNVDDTQEDSAPGAPDMEQTSEQAPQDLLAAPVDRLVEAATEAPAPAPVEVPQTIEVPKPASTFEAGQPFKPGQPFRPGKRAVSPADSTWNDLDTNFYQHGADEKSENSTKIAAKPTPKPQRLSGKRVVLQAGKVDQSVVYRPPARSASVVAVTPLPATFRAGDDSYNWLRQTDHSTVASASEAPRVYEVTDASEDGPFFTTVRTPAISHAVETQVRLKAIPLNRRIAEMQTQIAADQRVAQPAAATISSPSDKVSPPITIEEDTEESVRVASPPKRRPQRPYTARATEKNGVVVPPWRMK